MPSTRCEMCGRDALWELLGAVVVQAWQSRAPVLDGLGAWHSSGWPHRLLTLCPLPPACCLPCVCWATASCLRPLTYCLHADPPAPPAHLPPLLSANTRLPPPFCLQGYGFLSENASFVDICNDHNLEFIG